MLATMTAAPMNIAEPSDNVAADSVQDAACGGRDAASAPVKQRRRGTELEAAIRNACVSELADVGYGNLTIESVASRAQTGKASIYRRWPTKHHLVMDSVSCMVAGPMLRLADLDYDDSVTTRDALLDLMMRVGGLMAGPEGDVMRSVMGESLRDAEFSGSFECDFYDPRKKSLLRLLQRGVDRGEVRPGAVDDVVVEMIAGALIHRILIRRRRPDRRDYEHILDAFVLPAISAR